MQINNMQDEECFKLQHLSDDNFSALIKINNYYKMKVFEQK